MPISLPHSHSPPLTLGSLLALLQRGKPLLVLWVLMELLHTQIDYLKGGKFNISVFVLVAMVAFIRKLMLASLKPEKIEVAYYPLVVVGVLGVVYWLIKKAEAGDAEKAGH